LPEKVDLEVPQPLAAEIYYAETCGRIDQSNRHRQATLQLERTFKTHDWSDQVNHSIFGMGVVDTWLVYSQCTQTEEPQTDFYEDLALEMLQNTYDNKSATTRQRSGQGARQSIDSSLTSGSGSLCGAVIDVNGRGRSGVGVHLTPSKRYK
jgi:hypothetical protein